MIPVRSDYVPDNQPKFASLRRDDGIGLCLRLAALTAIMFSLLAIAAFVRHGFFADVPFKWLLAVFLIVYVAMMSGLAASELPRNPNAMLLRLGVATFCRTAFPLLVIMLVARYSEPSFATSTVGFLAVFYLVGFPASIGLSLIRFDNQSSPNRKAVDRAAV